MKGGLISLAAATVGLTNEAAQHLEVRVIYIQVCVCVCVSWIVF